MPENEDVVSKRAQRRAIGRHSVVGEISGDDLCRGRSKIRPLRRHRMQASSTDNPKGQKALNVCIVWDFRGTRSEPVTAAVAGFSSAAWPEFEPPCVH